MARVLYDGLVEYDDGECPSACSTRINRIVASSQGKCSHHASFVDRHPRNYLSNGQGCRFVLVMDCRTRTGSEEEDGNAGEWRR